MCSEVRLVSAPWLPAASLWHEHPARDRKLVDGHLAHTQIARRRDARTMPRRFRRRIMQAAPAPDRGIFGILEMTRPLISPSPKVRTAANGRLEFKLQFVCVAQASRPRLRGSTRT